MKRRRGSREMLYNFLALSGMIMLLSACSNNIIGEYVAEPIIFSGGDPASRLNFRSDGIVDFNGTPLPYEIKENLITIKDTGGMGDSILIVLDDGSLQWYGVGTFKKKK